MILPIQSETSEDQINSNLNRKKFHLFIGFYAHISRSLNQNFAINFHVRGVVPIQLPRWDGLMISDMESCHEVTSYHIHQLLIMWIISLNTVHVNHFIYMTCSRSIGVAFLPLISLNQLSMHTSASLFALILFQSITKIVAPYDVTFLMNIHSMIWSDKRY